jgi:UDP-N-acetylglucosamine--N-acetylmuramyl-(pentapeptide) pyrophosphoryl-undecaprenol N-acetylglucosamine transferase
MEVPSIIHEQNAVPGRSNAMFFRIADRVAVSFEETVRSAGIDPEKAVVTGNPIRAAMFKDDKEEALNGFGLAKEAFTILVIGGSQGARSLNDAFLRAIAKIDKDMLASLQIIHITGVRDYSRVTADYEATGVTHRVFSFIDRIEDAYSAADLVITRAGASAIFEIAFFGRPMILVPYPLAMSHQASNAGVFADRLAAVMIRESGSLDEALREKVSELFGNRDRRRSLGESARRMSIPEAAENLAGEVLKLARKG